MERYYSEDRSHEERDHKTATGRDDREEFHRRKRLELKDTLRRGKTRHRSAGSCANPFILLSFLSLLIIPSLKITDKGLVDVDAFKLIAPVK